MKKSDPQIRIKTITPEMAQEWLATRNERNRKPNKPKIAVFARDMAAGRWQENGTTISFGWDGQLSDGQNRLAACVQANTSFNSIVISGLDPATQDTVDSGVVRKMSDNLEIRQVKNATIVASAIAQVALFLQGRMSSHNRADLSKQETLDFLEINPEITDSVTFGSRVYNATRLPKAVGTGLHYVMSRIDKQEANDFFESIIHGTNLDEGSPILAFRKYLQSRIGLSNTSEHRSKNKQTNYVYWAICIKTWNAWRRGDSIQILRWNCGSEAFPSPI